MYFKFHSAIRFFLMYAFVPLMTIGLISCTKKSVTTSNAAPTAESFFIIGSGGGVTGKYTQYKVFEKGSVELYDFKSKKYIPYSTLSMSLNEKLWTELQALNLSKMNIDQPGNYTYYIEIEAPAGRHKVKWSDEFEGTPPELKQFFRTAENALRETK